MENVLRYDGNRFITEEEIDKEFTGHWVLIIIDNDLDNDGYLVASAKDRDDCNLRSVLEDIGLDEYDGRAKIIYGCKNRGMNLHVELLG